MVLCDVLINILYTGPGKVTVLLIYSQIYTSTMIQVQNLDKTVCISSSMIHLGTVYIDLFSLQIWVNSRADWALYPWYGNQSRRRKTLNSYQLKSILKLTLCHILFMWRGW